MSSQPKLVYGQDELSSVIALYESYLIDVQSNLISQKQMNQKGQMFLNWVNDLLASKLRAMNQATERSKVEIFKQISIDQVDISTRILELEHDCVQKNTTIENHLYTIKKMEGKLTERESEIQKMKQEISELTEKIDKQQTTFKRETKEFKKTFRIIQQNTESDKQIFDSIQMEYEYEKAQKDIIKGTFYITIDQLQALLQQKTVIVKQLDDTKRLLRACQNKLEWEVKKKLSLQDVVKQKNEMIEKLIHQIQDLKDTFKNPYDGIQQDHLQQKQIQDLTPVSKQLDKNLLSQQMALRQSFFSEADLDEDFIRRNSFRKSFDEGAGNPSQNQFEYPSNQNNNSLYVKKTDYVHQNHAPYRDKIKSNKSSFHQEHLQLKHEQKPASTMPNKSSLHSPQSILIRDMQKSPTKSSMEKSSIDKSSIEKLQRRGPLDSSPQVNGFDTQIKRQKQDELQIITQKVQSETQSSTGPFRRNVPDLYFAHFLLTSQAVKIKEDCQEMLNIDVKQYYEEIIQKRVPMHIWDDWIREKLRIAVKDIKSKYLADSRRQRSQVHG